MERKSFQKLLFLMFVCLCLTGVIASTCNAQWWLLSSSSSSSSSTSSSSSSSSGTGTKELMVSGLTSPEDVLAYNYRFFVSSKGAVHELKKVDGVWNKTAIPVQYKDSAPSTCEFKGMAAMTTYTYVPTSDSTGEEKLMTSCVYVIGTEDSTSTTAKKYLFALNLNDANPVLKEIYRLDSIAMPDKLSAIYTQKMLYISDNGPKYRGGSLYRINILDDTSQPIVASMDKIHTFTDLKPSGLHRDYSSSMHVVLNPASGIGTSEVRVYSLTSDGLFTDTYTTKYSSRLSLLEDLGGVTGGSGMDHLVKCVIADSRQSKIIYMENNEVKGSAVFTKPTSVSTYSKNIIVTEGTTGRVYWYYSPSDWFPADMWWTN